MIDLRSDTITRPTKAMLEAMYAAPVGDDVFGEDPTINALEEKTAKLFGKEAAIFTPSGTMANQIAIKVHTQPGDEVICDQTAHVYNFEGGGIALNSGASIRLLHGDRGKFTAQQVEENINPTDFHYAKTSLVAIENTTNKGGGDYYDFADIEKIKTICNKYNLKFHVDGARLFNALVETGQSPLDFGKPFDSISICLSKGLGAPVGSILIGNNKFINKARRFRKIFGGGMRQAGYLAAACIYALDNHVERLKEDHANAKVIGSLMEKLPVVKSILPVLTNIVIFDLKEGTTSVQFLEKLKEIDILGVSFGPQTVRLTTHLDFSKEMLNEFEVKIKKAFLL